MSIIFNYFYITLSDLISKLHQHTLTAVSLEMQLQYTQNILTVPTLTDVLNVNMKMNVPQ